MDSRFKLLSYSGISLLRECPRKFELKKLSVAAQDLPQQRQLEEGTTFSFGHAFGEGVQAILRGDKHPQLSAFLAWDPEFFDFEDTRRKKSLWHALWATALAERVFRENDYLSEYELLYYQGKPAIELGFRITLPDGYTYRGYIDAVLKHKETGKILVLELKTTSLSATASLYKNSSQALGYSVILDAACPGQTEYEVLYLVYETKSMELQEFRFSKSLYQRAYFLQELLLTCQTLSLYADAVFPLHGGNCFNFFKDCEYFGICTLSTDKFVIAENLRPEPEYPISFTLEQLVENQLERLDETLG